MKSLLLDLSHLFLLSLSSNNILPTEHPIMRLCVLQSTNEGCVYEDNDPPANIQQHLLRGGYSNHQIQVDMKFLQPTDYAQQLIQLTQQHQQQSSYYDCFINLCDGAWDEPSVGIQVVDLLENKLNVPFTGADVNFYEPTRLQMKKVALACGILVPPWRFVYTIQELETLIGEFPTTNGNDDPIMTSCWDTSSSSYNHCSCSPGEEDAPLRFPLLVKHFSSYSSIGLTKDSKVWNVQDLKKQCLLMMETYGGCLVEEFIEGREFTVLVSDVAPNTEENSPSSSRSGIDQPLNVLAYDPVECIFGQGEDFKHYNLKWVDYEQMVWQPVQDAQLSNRLKDMAKVIFRGMQGRGYGRIDVRSDPSGNHLYLLEINPNCGIFYPEGFYGSADFILDKTDPIQGHAKFILNQVNVARHLWRTKNALNRLYESRYDVKKDSWGLFALRDYSPGDIVQYNEETSFQLVSKSHVLKTWEGSPIRKCAASDEKIFHTWDNFAAYCWPLNDNLFAMWKPNPDDWKPINHSCDPNVWNEFENGLNLVARYPIKAGEEIRMDYATFVGFFPEMKSFECDCGSAICRRVVTGMDIIRYPELAVRYRGHMSSYIASKAIHMDNHSPYETRVFDEKKDEAAAVSAEL